MTQDELKRLVAEAALGYVPPGTVIGIGSGSTVNLFIDALARLAGERRIAGAVSSSAASTARLVSHGIAVVDAAEVESLPVCVDGADEIDGAGCMIKGGGAALTREKTWPTASSALPTAPSSSRASAVSRCRSR